MTTLRNFGMAAILALGLAGQAVAEDVTADTVVAVVNGKEITVGHMIVARRTLPQQFQQLPPDVLWDGILEQLIQQYAVSQTATEGPNRGTRLSLENEESSLLAGQIMGAAVDAAVTEDALKQLYQERYTGSDPEEEFNAAHILVKTKEEAEAVRTEITEGADFAEVAKAKSTGPSGPNGGALGWFSKGMMVKPFEDAVVALKPGDVSEPIETQFGWHVITLIETRQKDAPPIAEVEGELTQALTESVIDGMLAKITSEAEITRIELEVDPAVLGNFDLLAQ